MNQLTTASTVSVGAETATDRGLTEAVVRTRARRALQRLRPLVDIPERTLP